MLVNKRVVDNNGKWIKSIFLTCFLLVISMASFAADYKCYVQAKGGKHYIVTGQGSSTYHVTQKLNGAKFYSSDIGKQPTIRKVKECVRLSQDFKSKQAQRLQDDGIEH